MLLGFPGWYAALHLIAFLALWVAARRMSALTRSFRAA